MRHTYASTLLSNGENIFWVVPQVAMRIQICCLSIIEDGYNRILRVVIVW